MRRAIILILFTLATTSVSAVPAIWGDLEAGPHPVGFRTTVLEDASRAPLFEQHDSDLARRVPIYTWYPAKSSRAKPMRFADYTSLMTDRDLLPVDPPKARDTGWKFFAAHTRELTREGESSVDQAREVILDLEMFAIRDALVADGRHPLVVFPGYAAANCVMGEYLASHGYYVISTPSYGSFDKDWDISSNGLETTVRDISFIVGEASKFEGVDRSSVAVMGVGVHANAGVVAAMRLPDIDAIVSLEGGLASPWESGIMTEVPLWDLTALRQPMLIVTAPFPSRRLEILDRYRYADRLVLDFPTMSEFHFLVWGMLEHFSPEILGTPPGNTKVGFEWGARYAHTFLHSELMGSTEARGQLGRSPEELGAPTSLFKIRRFEGLPQVPTFVEAKQLLLHEGPSSLTELVASVRERDPQPFSQQTLRDLNTFFAWQRDEDHAIRLALSMIWVESYPSSAQAHFRRAQALRAVERPNDAIEHYEKVIVLLEADNDPWVVENGRERIEDLVTQRIAEIDASKD